MAKMKKETAMMIGGGILLLGVGFFIFKKMRKKRKYQMDNLNPPTSSSSQYAESGSDKSSSGADFDPKSPARAIYESMKGFGTDEDLFFDTSRALSQSQRQKVKEYFDTEYGDLEDWIRYDFSGSDEREALALYKL